MTKTVKYILIAGGAVAAYYAYKALTAPAAPSGPLAGAIAGAKDLGGTLLTGLQGVFKGSGAPPAVPDEGAKQQGSTGWSTVGNATYSAQTGDGDAAISDGLGVGKGSARFAMPSDFYTYEDQAVAGVVPYSNFSNPVVRSYAG